MNLSVSLHYSTNVIVAHVTHITYRIIIILAAKNMRGEPIPGEHWVEIDLQGLYTVDKVLIDWEVAYSDQWSLMVMNINSYSDVLRLRHYTAFLGSTCIVAG